VKKCEQTDEPITAALKPLMRQRGVTFRALAELTRARDPTAAASHTRTCAASHQGVNPRAADRLS
jgi:hypothetical protein